MKLKGHSISVILTSVLLHMSADAVHGQGGSPLLVDIDENDLTSEQASRLSMIRSDSTRVNVRAVGLNQQVVARLSERSVIELNLYPQLQFQAIQKRSESWEEGEFTWIGRPPSRNETGDYVILVARDDNVTGIIWAYGELYGIWPLGSGVHAVYGIDQTKFPPEHPPGLEPSVPTGLRPNEPDEGLARDSLARLRRPYLSPGVPEAVQVNSRPFGVVVVYTQAAEDAAGGGSTPISNLISLAIAQANEVYGNTTVNPQAVLVRKEKISYTESGDLETDVNRLQNPSDGYMDNVHDIRAEYGGDVVVLLTGTGNYCGWADLNVGRDQAFAVVKQNCATSRYSFTHEIGHLFGAEHDVGFDLDANNPYPYNHGKYISAHGVTTVMSVKGDGGIPRIPYLSNPDVNYQGTPTGSVDREDNGRVHDERIFDVEDFMPPGAPRNLTWTNVNNHPRLSWEEPPGNLHALIRVYRNLSGCGINCGSYSLIAELLQGTTNYTDTQVTVVHPRFAANSAYYYVTATDLVAESPKSNTVSVPTNQAEKIIVEGAPSSYSLSRNFPNPFNPTTTITYDLPDNSSVNLRIVDLAGRTIRTLVSSSEDAGSRRSVWDARDSFGNPAPSGVYMFTLIATSLETGEVFTQTRKMLLLR